MAGGKRSYLKQTLATAAVVGLVVGLWAWPLWQGPVQHVGPPQDVVLAPRALPTPLRITVLGTSLSHNAPWTASLAQALMACLGPAEITVIARPGAGVLWGQGQVDTVAATLPDLVLVEFAINDADLRDGLTRARADTEMRALLAELAHALPQAALVEMTMSPAQGARGLLRPGLGARYGDVIARAGDGSQGAIDLYARWRALPRDARGLSDGLHPDPQIATEVTVAPIRDYIGAVYSAAACAGASERS